MLVLHGREQNGKITVKELEGGCMYFIDGEELTPLEVTKLALYFALNCEENVLETQGE
jgi:hypothetical protein